MEVYLSDEFKKDYAKIGDGLLRERVFKALKKLGAMPERGKPLQHDHKGERRLRVDPFRILYKVEGNRVEILCFEHRGKAY